MSAPTGRPPNVGTHAGSVTPSLDDRVGSVENELGRLAAWRVAQKEQLVQVRLRGDGIYDVAHSLGVVPILCELKEVVSAVGAATTPHGAASPYRKGEWNTSVCRMDVRATVGSLDNCVATFVVKGAAT